MDVFDIQGTKVDVDDVIVVSTLWGREAEMRVGVVTHFTHNRMYYEPMRYKYGTKSQKQAWLVIDKAYTRHTRYDGELLVVQKGGGIEAAEQFLRK